MLNHYCKSILARISGGIRRNAVVAVIFLVSGLGIATSTNATIQVVYPVWGYNSQEQICQIKQESATSISRSELIGEYWDVRDCRSANKEIIWHTGGGIIIWAVLFLLALVVHHVVLPKIQPSNLTARVVLFLQDIVCISWVLFLFILWQHYFDLPRAVYPYPGDIDHILYSLVINADIPGIFLGVYIVISVVRGAILWRKVKKKMRTS